MLSSFSDPRYSLSSKLISAITLSLLALNQHILTFLRLSLAFPLPLPEPLFFFFVLGVLDGELSAAFLHRHPLQLDQSISQNSHRQSHRYRDERTSLALTSAPLLARLGRSKAHGFDFLEDLRQVGGGAAWGGEACESGEELHVDLHGR